MLRKIIAENNVYKMEVELMQFQFSAASGRKTAA